MSRTTEMEEAQGQEVSVIHEVDIAEDIPNGDDSAFTDENQGSDEQTTSNQNAVQVAISGAPGAIADDGTVYVATPHTLLTAEQLHEAGFKTTHVVIVPEQLKTPTTPLPPPTPATPHSKEKGFRYQWDNSVHMEVLPVRCKNTNGELYKAKFGSGKLGCA